MTLELRLRDGDRRRFPVEAGRRLIIGRSADCDVTLADQSVSRRHCAVEAAGGALAVTDLGSVNGTFVNGRAVGASRLAQGDLLRVGSVELECHGEGGGFGRHRTAEIGGDASTIDTVVSRRIEPSRVDWLEVAAGGDERALLDRAQRHLTTLHAVAEMLSRAHDVTALSDAIVEAVLEVTGADRAALLVAGPDGTGAEPVAALGGGDAPLTVSRTIVAEVIGQGVSVFAHDATADPRFEAGASVVQQQVRSVMCVPLRTADAILGALYVDSLSGAGRFSDADLELLAAVGNQAGIALHRVRLMGDLERLFLDTVKAIAATVDAKDGYTHRHSERVAAFAGHIGAALGLSANDCTRPSSRRCSTTSGRSPCPTRSSTRPAGSAPRSSRPSSSIPRSARASWGTSRARPRRRSSPACGSTTRSGTDGVSRRPGGGGHPARRPPARRGRLPRRPDLGARLPRGPADGRGRPPAARGRRHALRPPHRRGGGGAAGARGAGGPGGVGDPGSTGLRPVHTARSPSPVSATRWRPLCR